jgi:hypothetical protein
MDCKIEFPGVLERELYQFETQVGGNGCLAPTEPNLPTNTHRWQALQGTLVTRCEANFQAKSEVGHLLPTGRRSLSGA